jgi:hypothetical protein
MEKGVRVKGEDGKIKQLIGNGDSGFLRVMS